MYNSITGTVTGKTDSSVFLTISSGIEFQLRSSMRTIRAFEKGAAGIKLYAYLHHKEDTMTLFGFAEESERSMFLSLIKVNGVGPRQAVNMLSNISHDELLSIINSEDITALNRVPGIGKKTAQKIILALKGKLASIETEDSVVQDAEVLESLASMGYDRKLAAAVLEKLAKDQSIAGLKQAEREKELLRRAIMELASA